MCWENMIYKLNLMKKDKEEIIEIENPEYLNGHGYNKRYIKELLKNVSKKKLDHLSDGTYKKVYYIDEIACKISKGKDDPIKNHERQINLRDEFD